MNSRGSIDQLFEAASSEIRRDVRDLIRQARATGQLAGEDRYLGYQTMRIIDNEQYLSDLKFEIAKKLMQQDPTKDEDTALSEVADAVCQEVTADDERRQKRAAKGIVPGDPLSHVRDLIRGKSWIQARNAVAKFLNPDFGDPDDEAAELSWSTMRDAAAGGRYKQAVRNSTHMPTLDQIPELARTDNTWAWTWSELGYPKSIPEKVKVFRGVPRPDVPIRAGDYCTTDRDYARSYIKGKHGAVISQILPSKDLRVDSSGLGGIHLIYSPAEDLPDPGKGSQQTLRQFYDEVNGT